MVALETVEAEDGLMPWDTGMAVCSICGHHWTAAIEVGDGPEMALECPSCGGMTGHFEHDDEGDGGGSQDDLGSTLVPVLCGTCQDRPGELVKCSKCQREGCLHWCDGKEPCNWCMDGIPPGAFEHADDCASAIGGECDCGAEERKGGLA